MKTKLILALSLACNLAMAIILIKGASVRSAKPLTTSDSLAPETAFEPAAVMQPAFPTTRSATEPASWLQQFRAAGIPVPLLTQLLVADFNSRWEERRRAFENRYWRGYEDDAARLRLDEERGIELERTLRAALGDDAFLQWDRKQVLGGLALDNLLLSADEEDALYRLQKSWHLRLRAFERRRISGELDEAAYTEQLSAAGDEFEQQRRTLLGEERQADLYRPRDHFNVELRRQLGNVALDDSAFDTIARAVRDARETQAALESRFEEGKVSADERDQQIELITAHTRQTFETIVGAGSYAAFEKRQDRRYQLLQQHAAALRLTTKDVDHLYQIARDYERSTREYQRLAQLTEKQGQNVDWAGVEQNLLLFTRHTEQMVRAYLGEERSGEINAADLLRSESR